MLSDEQAYNIQLEAVKQKGRNLEYADLSMLSDDQINKIKEEAKKAKK